MNYGKIKTYSRTQKPQKPKNRQLSRGIVLALVLAAVVLVGQVSALGSHSSTTKQPATTQHVKHAAKKASAQQAAPTQAVAEPTPPPVPLIDPNHCEPGRWWRADNYECIDKPTPVETPAPVSIPSPVATPSVVITGPAVSGGTNCDLARSLIAQYDWNQASAYAVMYQESSCNAGATNANDVHGSCLGSYGLFQISCENGVIYDAAANVAQAYAMYQARGWQPWGFTTCKIVACN